MTQEEFKRLLQKYGQQIETIRQEAHKIHADVNQHYDKIHPYGMHLDMVADEVMHYAAPILASEDDLLPLLFGTFFHDSIEDARLTYNDVKGYALRHMDERQALLAAEIVYALTNEKGRTRAERANERYYEGIRQTPYAPFVKLSDRKANTTHSGKGSNTDNNHMKDVYAKELPHFLEAIRSPKADSDTRFALPPQMVDDLKGI
ncbi:MAG: DUF927 domain-containing protein [Prevotella sp.]|nr:DUF927 domain-containing protein [Prevotella sp.]